MLRADLGQLRREGAVLVEARLPADDGLWTETDFRWDGDVAVSLTASLAGTGEVVARGRVEGTLGQECRRCLGAVSTPVEHELTLVFAAEEADGEGRGGDVYTFDTMQPDIDLSEAVREELVLAINPYVLCDPACRGLCSSCGADLNEVECDCVDDEPDPRWEALRALQDR